jgi:hypothetical protein
MKRYLLILVALFGLTWVLSRLQSSIPALGYLFQVITFPSRRILLFVETNLGVWSKIFGAGWIYDQVAGLIFLFLISALQALIYYLLVKLIWPERRKQDFVSL